MYKNISECVADYSNETEEFTIKSLLGNGFSVYEATAYLSKLRIKRLSENDNGCKNEFYNHDLRMPKDRMGTFIDKKIKR